MVKRKGKKRTAFTLMETLIVIAIMGIISIITIPMYRRYQIRSDLMNASQMMAQGAARARSLAQAGMEDSPWGFSMEHAVLFKGESYATRDSAFDETYPIPTTIDVTGTTEVWFEKISGEANAPGSIVQLLGNDGEQRIVDLELNAVGTLVNISDPIVICYAPSGQPAQTLYITDAELASYIAQGATQGACAEGSSSSVSGGEGSGSSSSAGGGGSGGGPTSPALSTKGIVLLNPSEQGSFNALDNARLTISSAGSLVINSAHSSAATLSGNARVTTPTFKVTGQPGVQVSDNAQVIGTIIRGSPPVADPLASIPMPQPGTSGLPKVNASGNASILLGPNTYKGISVSGNAHLRLNPGIYYVDGGFSVSGNGRVTGSGVTIYVTHGAVNFSGNGAISLVPKSSGPYAGLTIFLDRGFSSTVVLTGNGNLNIRGALYGANATFSIDGNGAGNFLGSLIVGKNLIMDGNAVFNMQ